MIRNDMPERDYHAHSALYASTLKAVHQHPLKKVRHDLDNRAGHNSAFTLGSAAHRLILEGTGDGIVLIDKPDYRTKEARVSRDAALAAGGIPLLPHEHDQVVAMCAAVKEDDTAGPLLTGHQPEVSVFADLYGQPCDLSRIQAVCARRGIPVICDSAEAVGARRDGRHAGADAWAAVFSFNGNKIITTSGGGMLASGDRALIDPARKLSQQARDPAHRFHRIARQVPAVPSARTTRPVIASPAAVPS